MAATVLRTRGIGFSLPLHPEFFGLLLLSPLLPLFAAALGELNRTDNGLDEGADDDAGQLQKVTGRSEQRCCRGLFGLICLGTYAGGCRADTKCTDK